LIIEYTNDEEYVQGIVFDGNIDSEFNFGLSFSMQTLKITGYNVIGVKLKDALSLNNSSNILDFFNK